MYCQNSHSTRRSASFFFCARPVPYALREKVSAELEQPCKADIINPVQFSQWVAPIVPMLKNDGSMRISGDYKQTINQVAIPDKYPLPKVDDLLASLAGCETFTKLDLAHAYQQLFLDEESSNLATQSTRTKDCSATNDSRSAVQQHPLFFSGLWIAYCKVFSRFLFILTMCWLQATQSRSTWPTWRKCYASSLPQECIRREVKCFSWSLRFIT